MSDYIRLLKLFFPYKFWMLGGAFLALLTILSNFGLLALSGWFLASAALAGLGGYATLNLYNFFLPAAGVRAFATTRVISRWLERVITHEATFRLLAQLRSWFYSRLEPLAPAGLQGYRSGDILSRLVADIDTLNNFYLRVFTPFLVAGMATVLMSGFFAFFSWRLAIALFLFLAVSGLVLPFVAERLGARSGAEMTDLQSDYRVQIVDGMQGMGELLTYGAGPEILRRSHSLNDAILQRQAKMAQISGLGTAGMSFMGNLAIWVILILAIPLIHGGHLGPSDLPMFALGVMGSFEAIVALPLAFQFLGQTRQAARRIFSVADSALPFPDASGPAPKVQQPDLLLKDVHLRYPGGQKDALAGLDLHIVSGSKVAILGATGAGKSSIANMLLRFYDYQSGSAQFGGHELKNFPADDLREYFAVVSQRSYLFHTTIRDNLLVAKGDAEEDELWAALAAAQLDDFVRSQPDGLDTIVGEGGVKLSGGQGRRVAIARAILKNAPWLVLDEPTEGLDPLTEMEFLRDLQPLMQGRTVLYITHRLLGLEQMDRVFIMDEGRVVESGTFAELLNQGGQLSHFATFRQGVSA
ncbi:thiol reductant ABC exporter subunit CydC [Acidithiobacillus thiooxidans]|uniref:Thiol reductant ABC exporter subunit CydC n=1 Tax=Acidithiobacillus thiooxidans ATCC 19377 TaxID=637390 RepID=A0A5P9XQL7_ACITH|nr:MULTISPECIES: thiol reductant ABC exporter subunit CydC [Acidithiobacillus]MBU2741122.1 thiol reductant ABC exporter subunit CydC [Acidithiobacillus albertensis]MBU2794277.1 thiol reductant ABC exporter subunit CydC [Acidithiobacillus thiooxidans]MBU2835794.1 thiol reductant ABC exporter subunit CydC [Acidithiobacillus thiooxidans]MDA8175937.1 thiol reductant ABC exporter subunit CydC [Acidithiobacillus sp.]QFX95456.1 thiol reductant ABC exporter subunit CydC [Acidithiobacillus thiooxidans 